MSVEAYETENKHFPKKWTNHHNWPTTNVIGISRLEKKRKKNFEETMARNFQFVKNYKHTDPRISTKPRHKKHRESTPKHATIKLVKMSDKKENVQWTREKKDQDVYVFIREKCKYKLKKT